MISQEFTVAALNRMRRRGAQFKYKADDGSFPKSQAEWTVLLTSIQNQILDGTFRFRSFNARDLSKGKKLFSTHSLENIMVMRKINDNIRRAYRVKQANRFDIIKQIQQALKETTPKHVIRLDIRSFYESVPRRRLVEKIRADRLVSTRTLELLSRLLRLTSHSGSRGLPRGLQVSATLAEIHASHLERDLRAIEGVYYVARYVDDIVIFSYVEISNLERKIYDAFEVNGLRVNASKTRDISVQCRCAAGCIHPNGNCACSSACKCNVLLADANIRQLDILGYKLAFPDVNEKKRFNPVGAYMADKKMAKYKSRIHAATREYLATHDFSLLRDRVLFLTGNYKLDSLKVGGSLCGGIFYNFDLYRPLSDDALMRDSRLEHLDKFLIGSLLRAFKIHAPPSRNERREVLSLSFVNGHRLRRMRKLAPKRISEIGRCWREA
ncbi:hypothetical protein I5U73_11775 [Stenotrophomonas maltophilia]|nr:hypothetical protein [Stenotrophomonas maltophilia]